MIKPKMILMNGPAKSGKDVALKYLDTGDYPVTYMECKDTLHLLTRTLFTLPEDKYWELYNNRDTKEVPTPFYRAHLSIKDGLDLANILGYCFRRDDLILRANDYSTGGVNLSPREALVYISEIVVKPRWGKDYFGKARVISLQEALEVNPVNTLYVDGSCAFDEEIEGVINIMGQDNVLLLRIHRDGYTFDGDSRSYISDGLVDNTIDIYNNRTEIEYLDIVSRIVKKFIHNV
jgi:hypothetical protein